MKKVFITFSIIFLFMSCCNTKSAAQEKTASKDFDKALVINDNVTVNKGKLIGTTKSVSKINEVEDIPKKPSTTIPNTPKIDPIVTKEELKVIPPMTLPHLEINTVIHDSFNTLLQKHVSQAGNVNYASFKKDRKALLNYISILGENLPKEDWSQEEKLAYWMNAYNAMTVDLILRNLPLKSIKDIKDPWKQRYWKLGDKYYNLDEIEHQILRKMNEPRIHFGINCASYSCPPLLNEAFTPAKVDAQLEKLATQFINDSSRNKISENSIEISNIFKWFSKDFKQNGSVIDYLNTYTTVKIFEDAKVRYMDYDWNLNI